MHPPLWRTAVPLSMLALAVSATLLPAQYMAPDALTQEQRRGKSGVAVVAISALAQQPKPSRKPYIITGVVVGAVVGAILGVRDVSKDDVMLGEIAVVAATVSGALVGGVLGWAIAEIRRR